MILLKATTPRSKTLHQLCHSPKFLWRCSISKMFCLLMNILLMSVNCLLLRSQFSDVSCPQHCVCMQWDGISGYFVDCTFGNLDTIPVLESTNTISFNISSNHLKYLTHESFGPSFADVKHLDLSHNLIETIEDNTFKHLESLEILNLCDNVLHSVPDVLPSSLRVLSLNSNNLSILDLGYSTGSSIANLKSLYLGSNGIKEIRSDSNVVLNSFSKLQELKLIKNQIMSITRETFSAFRRLKFLSLSTNLLDDISADAFNYNLEIEVIDLSVNKITRIFPGMFKDLSQLKYLSLSNNEIMFFPIDIPLLEWLDLSHNSITRIPEESKFKIYPPEVLLLGGNPFHCDCDLLWLKEFYDTREYKLAYLDVNREKFIPICATPPMLANETWDLLSSDMFRCNQLKIRSSNIAGSDTLKLPAEKSRPVKMTVMEIGPSTIMLYWDQYKQPSSVTLSFHKSGQKHMGKKIAIEPSVESDATFILNDLEPSIAYIICLSVEFILEFEQTLTHGGCLEVKTTELMSYTQVVLNEGLQCSNILLISILCIIVGYWLHRSVEIKNAC